MFGFWFLNYGVTNTEENLFIYFCNLLPHQNLPILTLTIILSRAFSTMVGSPTPGASWLKLNFCVKIKTKHTPLKKPQPIKKTHPKPHHLQTVNCVKSIQQVVLRQLCFSLLADGTIVIRKETGVRHGKDEG